MIGFTALVLLFSVESAILTQDFAPTPSSPNPPSSWTLVRTPPEEIPGEPLDYQGHNKEWWQERIRSLEREKTEILDKISQTKEQFNAIPPNLPIARKRMIRMEIAEELKVYNEELQKVDRIIKKQLPEEARKAGAPPGWLR